LQKLPLRRHKLRHIDHFHQLTLAKGSKHGTPEAQLNGAARQLPATWIMIVDRIAGARSILPLRPSFRFRACRAKPSKTTT